MISLLLISTSTPGALGIVVGGRWADTRGRRAAIVPGLIGAIPDLLEKGVPDDAFKPLTGDDKTVIASMKQRNKQARSGQASLFGGVNALDVGGIVERELGFQLASMERTRIALRNPDLTITVPVRPDGRISVPLIVQCYDLDAIAARLGVAISGRHTALGDAMATAAVFVALLDVLERRGTTTLDQLLRSSRMAMELRPIMGWREGAWLFVFNPIVDIGFGPNGGGYVELPYTLPQDSTMFLVLQEKSTDIWKQKLDWLVQRGGMALVNVHPDYVGFGDSLKVSE